MVQVYYFYGSGNSYSQARSLAEGLKGSLASIRKLRKESVVSTEADTIGLVFPVYGGKLPKPVREFLDKLEDLPSKEFFAVSCHGISPSHSVLNLQKELQKRGGRLRAGFSVHLPHNGIGCGNLKEDEIRNLVAGQKEKTREIIAYLKSEKQGYLEKSGRFSEFFSKEALESLPLMFKLLGVILFKGGLDTLRYRPQKSCVGCGSCVRLCPVENISLREGRPVWGGDCMGCQSCFHWCPEDAVRSGNLDMNMKQYHHPEVSLQEIL